MKFALFCVDLVLQCIWMHIKQNGPFVVVTIDLLKGLTVLVNTFLSLFKSTPDHPLSLLSGHIY